jgi:hypothetical protein
MMICFLSCDRYQYWVKGIRIFQHGGISEETMSSEIWNRFGLTWREKVKLKSDVKRSGRRKKAPVRYGK